MSLTKAQLLTFAGTLCNDLDDSTTISVYFNDVIYKLGQIERPPFVEWAQQKITSGTATYNYQSDEIRPLHTIMEEKEIFESSEDDLEAYDFEWRTATGVPFAYTEDIITARTYKLVPKPDFTSGTAGSNWGSTYPDDILALIYAQDRTSDIEDYFVLPIAFDILNAEFTYPSPHQDLTYATRCAEIAEMLYKLAGVL